MSDIGTTTGNLIGAAVTLAVVDRVLRKRERRYKKNRRRKNILN